MFMHAKSMKFETRVIFPYHAIEFFFSKEHSKYDCEAYFTLRFKDNKDIKNSIYNISKERKMLFTVSLNFY